QVLRPGVRAGEQHLDRDGSVEAEVAGPEDDPHAAAPDHLLDLVARELRQGQPLRRLRGRPTRGRGEGVEVRPEAAELAPAAADGGQQLGARPADLFRRDVRVEEFVNQLLDARVVGHTWTHFVRAITVATSAHSAMNSFRSSAGNLSSSTGSRTPARSA